MNNSAGRRKKGYIALRDNFETDRTVNRPAIVVLPTGCGMSSLIACASFGIAAGRVLVVAPNLTIKDGLAEGTFSGTAASTPRWDATTRRRGATSGRSAP